MESAAHSIVSKFGQVLLEELQEIRGVGDKVVHLRDELVTMNAVLRVISEADQDKVDHVVREWEKQVHDLVYDAEDCTDTYSLRIIRRIPRPPPPAYDDVVGSTTLAGWLVRRGSLTFSSAKYLLAQAKRISRYPYEKLVLQRALAADIKDLLARTTIVSERRARYGIDRATLQRAAFLAPVSATSISANALRFADEPDQFVGIAEQANALANKIKVVKAPVHDEEDKIKASFHDPRDKMKVLVYDEDDQIKVPIYYEDEKIKEPIYDEDDKSLKVFSIVGFGGLGKTTLAMELCRQLDADFPLQAQVSVSQAFNVHEDMKGLLVRVLLQIHKEKPNDKQTNKEEVGGAGTDGNQLQIDRMDVEDLSKEIKKLLKQTRYVVVIDDVWSIPAWEAIRIRLPENNCGSRIIVTTRIEAVAKAATVSEYFVHHMKPLEREASEKLFFKRVFGSTEKDTCPTELKETVDTILKRCGGLPLAIVSIASILATYRSAEGIEMWKRVSRSIGSQMESHPNLEGMRQLITLSYDYLPHHLKACMMYLSIFPEDYVVAKDRLLYRWIAEGLVTEKRGLTLLEVAEEYFNELISRNMIQQDKFVSRGVEVEGCRVHDMILEVMVSKSQESNFVTLVGRQYGGMTHGHGKVRRLSIHDNDQGHEKVEAMKVQHVRSLTTFPSDGLDKLVDRLGEFKLLRVLDLEDCKALQNRHMRDVCRLYLLRFLRLTGTDVSRMPGKIGNLEHLETLDIKDTHIGTKKLPRTMKQLSKLERLRCNGWLLPQGIGNMKALHEVDCGCLTGDDVKATQEIGELPQLQVLSIYIINKGELKEEFLCALASSLSKTSTLRSLWLECMSGSLDFLHDVSPPPLLQCLSVRGRISQLPDWISSVTHLTKFLVGWTELAGDQLFGVLCKLPNLQSVLLVKIQCKDRELVARPEHSFPVLRILEVFGVGRSIVLTFEKGSMTKLETLTMWFLERETRIAGLENLENLKEVALHGWKGNPGMEHAVEQLKAHPNSKQIKVVVDWRKVR